MSYKNIKRFVAMWLGVFLVCPSISSGIDEPEVYPNVQFKYTSESIANGTMAFPEGKTDYHWGTVEKRGDVVRILRHDFTRAAPEDALVYHAVISEAYSYDEHTILYMTKELEFRGPVAPATLEESMRMHRDAFSEKKRGAEMRHYMKTTSRPAHEEMLGGYWFLGMTRDGPINSLAKGQSDTDGKTISYSYKSKLGVEHQLVFDSVRRVFTKATSEYSGQDSVAAEDSSRSKMDPFTRVDERHESAEGFVIKSKSMQNPSSPAPYIVTETMRVSEFSAVVDQPVTMNEPPENGDPIGVVGGSPIKYAWLNGRIVKAVNMLLIDDVKGSDLSLQKSTRRWFVGLNAAVFLGLAICGLFWKWRRGRNLLALLAILCSPDVVAAGDAYCGMYSLFGAATSLGIDVDIDGLIDPQFISSGMGSTAEDIVEAADKIGLKAIALRGLGKVSLKAADSPLILHAAPLAAHGKYQHWILFLGIDEGGNARVVDGEGGVVACSINEVLSRWDGVAIAVRKPGSAPTRFLPAEAADFFVVVAIGCLCSIVFEMQLLNRLKAVVSSKLLLCFGVFGIVLVSGVLGNLTRGDGFFDAAHSIDAALGLRRLDEVQIQELPAKLARGALLVDCRYSGDYASGHIPGAISIPVDSGLGELTRAIDGIDRSVEVILYCQSEGCSFSDLSATMLARNGFSNIKVFRGGWVSWELAQQAVK